MTKPVKRVFKYRSYTEEKVPVLDFEDVTYVSLYDHMHESLLVNCICGYLNSINRTEECGRPVRIPPENICKQPLVDTETLLGDYVWTESDNTYIKGVQALPLNRDANLYDLNVYSDKKHLGEKARLEAIGNYNSKRELVVNKLKEIGNPPVVLESTNNFMYMYVNLKLDTIYIAPKKYGNPYAYEINCASPELTLYDENCILQTLSREITTLCKDDQINMIYAMIRWFFETEFDNIPY